MRSIRFGLIAIAVCGLIVLAVGIRVAIWTQEGEAIALGYAAVTDQLATLPQAETAQIERLRSQASDLAALQRQKFHSIYALLAIVVVGVDLLVIIAVLALGTSVQRIRQEQREQVHEAMHDALTGLPNRRYFGDWLMRSLATARRSGRQLVLLYIDLDGFKGINDRFGHEAGDRVLQVIATRLRRALRVSDFVARLGGDEFVAVLPDAPAGPDLSMMIERLQAALHSAPIAEVEDGAVAASIGTAWFPADGEDVETLLAAADHAMYQVKQQRRATAPLLLGLAESGADPTRHTA